jgi:hypothetical protein
MVEVGPPAYQQPPPPSGGPIAEVVPHWQAQIEAPGLAAGQEPPAYQPMAEEPLTMQAQQALQARAAQGDGLAGLEMWLRRGDVGLGRYFKVFIENGVQDIAAIFDLDPNEVERLANTIIPGNQTDRDNLKGQIRQLQDAAGSYPEEASSRTAPVLPRINPDDLGSFQPGVEKPDEWFAPNIDRPGRFVTAWHTFTPESMRSHPSLEREIFTINKGEIVAVIQKSPNGTWVYVERFDNAAERGWVPSSFLMATQMDRKKLFEHLNQKIGIPEKDAAHYAENLTVLGWGIAEVNDALPGVLKPIFERTNSGDAEAHEKMISDCIDHSKCKIMKNWFPGQSVVKPIVSVSGGVPTAVVTPARADGGVEGIVTPIRKEERTRPGPDKMTAVEGEERTFKRREWKSIARHGRDVWYWSQSLEEWMKTYIYKEYDDGTVDLRTSPNGKGVKSKASIVNVRTYDEKWRSINTGGRYVWYWSQGNNIWIKAIVDNENEDGTIALSDKNGIYKEHADDKNVLIRKPTDTEMSSRDYARTRRNTVHPWRSVELDGKNVLYYSERPGLRPEYIKAEFVKINTDKTIKLIYDDKKGKALIRRALPDKIFVVPPSEPRAPAKIVEAIQLGSPLSPGWNLEKEKKVTRDVGSIIQKNPHLVNSFILNENKLYEPILYMAAKYGEGGVVQQLIRAGANIEGRGGTGMTALMVAALIGDYDIMKDLIVGGADVDAVSNKGWGVGDYMEVHLHKNYKDSPSDRGKGRKKFEETLKLQRPKAKR